MFFNPLIQITQITA